MPAVRFLSTPLLRSAALPFAANGVLYGTWAARIPEVRARCGLSEGELGLALLGLAVGLIVAASLAGRLVARRGALAVTRVGLVLFGVAVVGPGLATGLWSLAAVLVAVGLASGLLDVSMNAWAADVEGAADQQILGSCHGMFSLGGMVGAGLGALAAAADVPLAAHLAASGLAFAGGAWFQSRGLTGGPRRAPVEDTSGPIVALPTGPVAGLAVLACCGLIVEGAVADWGAVFLRQALGAPPATAALAFGVFSACMAAARFGADRLTARLGDRRLLTAGASLGAVGLALCVAAPAVPVALAGFAALGLGFAASVPVLFRAASRAPGLKPGVGIAAVTSSGYAGFLAGPPVLGFVAEAFGMRSAFGVLVVLAAVVALGAGPALRAARGPAQPQAA